MPLWQDSHADERLSPNLDGLLCGVASAAGCGPTLLFCLAAAVPVVWTWFILSCIICRHDGIDALSPPRKKRVFGAEASLGSLVVWSVGVGPTTVYLSVLYSKLTGGSRPSVSMV